MSFPLQVHGHPVEYSDTGLEYLNECDDYDTIFILDNFESELFFRLHRAGARIMGPPVIIKTAENEDVSTMVSSYESWYCIMFHDHLVVNSL